MNMNYMRCILNPGAVICAVIALVQTIEVQGAVRLHGAVTMEKLVTQNKAAIEAQAGTTLEAVGNGSGRGLVNLASGNADIAMIGGSLKGVADAMNKEKPGSVDITGMQETPIIAVKISIVTHSGVGIKSLNEAQLRDVFSGKATNWKEVGGPDVPIKVVLPFPGDGVRISLQDTLMKDVEFAKSAIVRTSAKDIAPVLAQLPGSCSVLTYKNAEPTMGVISTDKEYVMPVQFVVKGEPAGDVKKVLDAAKAIIK
jgi:phosphate transport system substrate-binding protein